MKHSQQHMVFRRLANVKCGDAIGVRRRRVLRQFRAVWSWPLTFQTKSFAPRAKLNDPTCPGFCFIDWKVILTYCWYPL